MKDKSTRLIEALNIRKDLKSQNITPEVNSEVLKLHTALSTFVNTGLSSTTKIKLDNTTILQLNCSNNQKSGILVTKS